MPTSAAWLFPQQKQIAWQRVEQQREGGEEEGEGGAGVAQVLLHFRQVMKFRKKLIGKAQGPATK